MQTFSGFPHGSFQRLPVPPTFFSELLPLIDDLDELKVTLFCFHALNQREKAAPYLRYRHFRNDEALMSSMGSEQHLRDAIAKVCARQTLLSADVTLETRTETLYFVNTPTGRDAMDHLKRGHWRPTSGEIGVEILPERPNVYTLYEQNIGMLTAHIAEEIKDAEQEFPVRWLEDAIKIAVESNKRNWRYVRGILLRWKQEGRTDEPIQKPDHANGKRYVSGKYADIIES